jgi:hypothetical protein
MQRDDKNVLHPVAFFSKTMNKAQRNYDVYNRELLGLRETLRHGGHICIKPSTKSRFIQITPTYYSGRIQGNIIEEWHDGMQNLWNTTSNWFTYLERRMDVLMPYLDAQTTIQETTIISNLWCYHQSSLVVHMPE